jgi:uracil phosphoribosyltransferase|tara:strand:+ start:1003 stop:1830 length:828 start_codon:yes stop_codon:yes gene_type:complete
MSLAMSLEARATRALTVRARRSANGSGTVGAVGPLARRATRARASAGEGSEDAPPRAQPNPNQMLVLVPPHPLLKHWLGVARNVQTPTPIFRAAMAEIGRILIYECGRDWLQTFEAQVQGPLAIADVEFVNPEKPVAVVPILRAGLTLLEESASVLPSSVTHHLGYVRDEKTLEPKMYLNKLPASFAEDAQVLISDPMLATGGTIVAAVEEIVSRGASPSNIRIICVVASPPALTQLSERYPGLRVYAAMIDEVLNDDGYVVPGLGDAGDRAFGT